MLGCTPLRQEAKVVRARAFEHAHTAEAPPAEASHPTTLPHTVPTLPPDFAPTLLTGASQPCPTTHFPANKRAAAEQRELQTRVSPVPN